MAQATMAAANAFATGTLGSHLSRPHAASDSRLLSNLIKSERHYITSLHSSVSSAHAASSALSAWGTSEAPDVADTSAQLSSLLSACTDVQSTHVTAIEGYRAALKDVADREVSIRNVVRDRDILVSRLIKASNKKASNSSKKSPEERAEKVALAQRELQACEDVLTSEEAALVGVKRRTFKEALTMRMKTMGDAGAAMVDAAKEAILLLDTFDSNAHQMPHSPTYDEQVQINNSQEWYPYQEHPQNEEERSEERLVGMNANFENSSVTPSQSASQVYQPNPQRYSAAYSAPFHGIGETEGETQRYSEQQQAESDSDEEDWKRSFGQGQETVAHQGRSNMPAPHQLSGDVGSHRAFIPHAADLGPSPAPTPPAKDEERRVPTRGESQSAKKKKKPGKEEREFGPVNTVAMPPVPTAPRLHTDGIDMGPIPSAPKLYMPGASGQQDDSESEEGDERNTVSHRGGGQAGWNIRSTYDNASSDGEATAKQSSRPDGMKRGNSFFGKVGKLFKTDVKGEEVGHGRQESRSRKESHGSSGWASRTDGLSKDSRRSGAKDPSSLSRRQSVLRGPLVRDGQDSSDEEPIDERKMIRVTNPRRPLWQGEKPSSDVGSRSKLKDDLRRPGTLRRTPSASITAGPLSWKAKQDEEAARAKAEAEAAATAAVAAPSLKKKKKKSKKTASSVDGGSEIGTQATRVRPSVDQGSNQRQSFVVTGDASAGVRRSESQNYGTRKSNDDGKLARKASNRLSAMSTQNMHSSNGTKQGAMTPVDRQGKFTTNNWVAKSNHLESESARPVHGTGVPSTGPSIPSKLKESQSTPMVVPKHVPQPSASMSPPLKPALKVPGSSDLARSGSVASSAAGSSIPTLPPPMAAPAPVTSMRTMEGSSLYNATPSLRLTGDGVDKGSPSVLSIEMDKRFDGTGKLDVGGYAGEAKAQQPSTPSKRPSGMALPKIDMPASEPFRVDLESRRGSNTPQRESSGADLMTPGERLAYESFMSQANEGAEPYRTHGNQPSGVTRFTDRSAVVGKGALGVADGSPLKKASPQAPGKLSRTYSDPNVALSSDSSEGGRSPTGALQAPVQLSSANTGSLAAVGAPAVETSEASAEGGSALGRRKSVRMAPDVKLPPETPTEGAHRSVNSYDFNQPGSALSSRIAPPPAAPPRLSTHADRPVDLGAHPREVQGWSVRSTPMIDSSDEEGGDQDDYEQARKTFGDVSKSWGKSSRKKKTGGDGGSQKEGSIKKSKKKSAQSGSGYNPAIPLPARMEVVGRSGSVRK